MKRSKSKDISVTLGKTIDIHSATGDVKKSVFDLSVESWKAYAEGLPSVHVGWPETTKEVRTNYVWQTLQV